MIVRSLKEKTPRLSDCFLLSIYDRVHIIATATARRRHYQIKLRMRRKKNRTRSRLCLHASGRARVRHGSLAGATSATVKRRGVARVPTSFDSPKLNEYDATIILTSTPHQQ